MNVSGYETEEPILESLGCTILRGTGEGGSRVLIKVATDPADATEVSDRLEWEFEITRRLQAEGVLPVLELVQLERGNALVLEDQGLLPLRKVLAEGPLECDSAVAIAIELAAILGAVHREGVVHKALHPDRIFVDPEGRGVRLTGFEAASSLPDEKLRFAQLDASRELLRYLAPEQTGRMNRRAGRRADLYSLGVLLYEMLTGSVPFDAEDPLELIHAHLAREPVPPLARRPELPRVVSDIVLKLLAKAGERYQSALGVRADLVSYRDGRTDAEWEPGARDVSDRLEIPEQLYGRQSELDLLMQTFDRVATGATELLMVSGYSGIGKSALVDEIHRPIVHRKGYFISGKFDQLQRNIPYSAVISAFRELTHQLLTESESQIASWRSRLQEALEQNGQVITEVISEIEFIIGPQPPVPELPPAETKNRFNRVFDRFLKVFAQADHPLVVFLDDLQWADTGTLELIEELVTDRTLRHLLIIGAYRDNEVGAGHPLTNTLAELAGTGATVGQIQLQPLPPEDLLQFVADTMRCPTRDALPLSELIHEKTGGNPFFVIQFVKLLHDERLLTFDHERGRWAYDLDGIRGMGITDNVVDLMVRKLERLPASTRDVVKLAACIGNVFDLSTLAIVRQSTPESTALELRDGVQEGLILSGSRASSRLAELGASVRISNAESATYRFLHDRVQQAAYALIPDDSKRVVHLQVGRLRWQHSDEEKLDEQLFEIVGHLNVGASLITDEVERRRLADLNLAAGRRAKRSTAYEPALAYFEAGIELLPARAWTAHYELSFALHLERAEAAYLCGDFERAELELDHLLERAVSPVEKAEIYRMRIVQYENTSRFPEARDWGKTGLALFDIVFPDDPEQRQRMLDDEMQTIGDLIGDREIAELVRLPEMTDAAMRISMKLLMTMWAPSYISGDMMLTALIAAKMVRLSLQFGNVEESAYGYVTYGATVGLRKGDYASSYAFGRLSLAVNERFDDQGARAKVNHMFSCYIGLWREPIASCFPYSREAHLAGLSSGDFIYSAYGVYHESWHALFRGQRLDQYYEHYAPYLEFMTRTKNRTFYDAHLQVLQLAQALRGRTEHPCTLTNADFDEEMFLESYGQLGFFLSIYYVTKLQLLYLFGEYDQAASMADEAVRLADKTEGMIWDAWRCFYQALNLAARYSSLGGEARSAAEAELASLQSQLQTWAENSPANFSHRHALVLAESAAARGDVADAIDAYETAIAEASRHGFVQIEALACERYARFWLERGNEPVAVLYLRAARRCWSRWGATAKVEDLEAQYPGHLVVPQAGVDDMPALDKLDLTTVLRAAQVISGEVEQKRLLERLLRILVKVAGAQRVCLLLEREGKLTIEAEGTTSEEIEIVDQARSVDSSHLASSVVYYVARMGESVVLADATRNDRFSNDPYIQEREPLSLLCMPIFYQGKAVGMLYLENNLVRDAFTPDRIEVVGILASQAAISLENSRLYEDMKQEVTERKRAEEALRMAHDDLERRVRERTVELSHANVRLEEGIAERRRVERELYRAKDAAEAANNAKSEFLASMSHELRTPLNAILGYAQILRRDTTLEDSQQSGVAVIERSGEHLATLINDILSLSKIEAGKLEVSPSDFYLQTFLDDVVDIARVRAEQKGLDFTYEPVSPLPAAVRCDERLLRQVLLNLLSNAAKFTDRGGVALRVQSHRDSEPETTNLRFTVEDTGIGIAADKLEEIFEPFHQVHRADRLEEGTGLGLAISRKLVQLMGGAIDVRSTPGQGSVFVVDVPLAGQPAIDVAAGDRPITGYRGKRRRILVVDDKPDNRLVIIGLLRPLGFELAEAADGHQAVERAEAWRPHAVLMDLVMPKMDGFEATRRIRKSPAVGDPVVLALSASVFDHNRQESLDAGCHDFIPKPVKAELLFDKLRHHLELEWTYEGRRKHAATEGACRARRSLEPPSADVVANLHRLAKIGDIRGMLEELGKAEVGGGPVLPFVRELRRLADDYDMPGIVQLLRPYLSQVDERQPG